MIFTKRAIMESPLDQSTSAWINDLDSIVPDHAVATRHVYAKVLAYCSYARRDGLRPVATIASDYFELIAWTSLLAISRWPSMTGRVILAKATSFGFDPLDASVLKRSIVCS